MGGEREVSQKLRPMWARLEGNFQQERHVYGRDEEWVSVTTPLMGGKARGSTITSYTILYDILDAYHDHMILEL